MRKILILLAEGFEEIEAVTAMDVLRRAGYQADLAGLKPGEVTGSRRLKVVPDMTLDQALKNDYDMVVLPGGQPGTDHLKADARVLDLLRKMDSAKKWIAAICAAPLVIAEAGIGEGRQLTCYPAVEEGLGKYRFSEERVVRDGHIITSRGPGSAMEFGLELVAVLSGKIKAAELAKTMVVEGF